MPVPEPCLRTPIRFDTANPVIRIHPDDGGVGTEQNVTLSVAVDTDYYMVGDAQSDDLIEKLELALNTNTDGEVFTVFIDDRGVVRIVAATNAFKILWTHASTTVDPELYGFADSVLDGATSYTAPNSAKGIWIPGEANNPRSVTMDERTNPVTVSAITTTVDGQSRGYQIGTSLGERSISFRHILRSKTLTEFATGTEPYMTLEWALENGLANGRDCRWYNDRTKNGAGMYDGVRYMGGSRPWVPMDPRLGARFDVGLDFGEVSNTFSNTNSLLLDGVNEYVNVPYSSDMDVTNQLTVSAWLHQPTTWNSADAAIGRWQTAQRVFKWWSHSSGRMRWYFADSLTDPGSNHVQTSATNVFVADTWYHVVVVYNAGSVTVYVDGNTVSLTTTGTIPGSLTSGTSVLQLGADGNNNEGWNGYLDEVMFFNSALTAGHIQMLRRGGSPSDPRANSTMRDSLIGWYRCGDGDTHPKIADWVYNNHGTATNTEAGDITTTVP